MEDKREGPCQVMQTGWPKRILMETAATGDGHFHPENKGTSDRVSQSEPSIENIVDFEKYWLFSSGVVQLTGWALANKT